MRIVDPAEVSGRRLAVLVVLADQDEEGVVVQGFGRSADGGLLRFELPGGAGLEIPQAALEELSPVPDGLRDLLGDAEYWLTLTVGSSPGQVSHTALMAAGIPWPAPGR